MTENGENLPELVATFLRCFLTCLTRDLLYMSMNAFGLLPRQMVKQYHRMLFSYVFSHQMIRQVTALHEGPSAGKCGQGVRYLRTRPARTAPLGVGAITRARLTQQDTAAIMPIVTYMYRRSNSSRMPCRHEHSSVIRVHPTRGARRMLHAVSPRALALALGARETAALCVHACMHALGGPASAAAALCPPSSLVRLPPLVCSSMPSLAAPRRAQ